MHGYMFECILYIMYCSLRDLGTCASNPPQLTLCQDTAMSKIYNIVCN